QNRGAAMSLVDSAAVFEGRARVIGLPDATITAMGLRGWTTHATFAFSVATQPGVDEQVAALRKRKPAANLDNECQQSGLTSKRKRLDDGPQGSEGIQDLFQSIDVTAMSSSFIGAHQVDAPDVLHEEAQRNRAREIPLPKKLRWRCGMQPDEQTEQLQKMGSGTQPRGGRSPVLMAEFQFKVDITTFDVAPPQCIAEDSPPPFQGIPVGAKLISSRNFSEVGKEGEKKEGLKATYGVFSSPWDFLRRALAVEHPLDTPQLVDKSNLRAIVFLRDHSVADVKAFRAKQLRRFVERAEFLKTEEEALKATLDGDVRAALAPKRLLLFKEMMEEAGVGDKGYQYCKDIPRFKPFGSKRRLRRSLGESWSECFPRPLEKFARNKGFKRKQQTCCRLPNSVNEKE
ncbi:unnamed protein product, partial [Cladocopium goreaui]